jgi:hypothetical protein
MCKEWEEKWIEGERDSAYKYKILIYFQELSPSIK